VRDASALVCLGRFEKPLFDLERAGREVKLKEVKRGLRRLN
jgi:hypothetical protein